MLVTLQDISGNRLLIMCGLGAWDFDWAVTFSKDMGFLQTGTDVQGLIHTGERTMRYLGCVSEPKAALGS